MKKYFGGSYLIGKRKSKRPLDDKNVTHLVLRLKENLPSFLSPRDKVLRDLFCKVATKHEIQINHLIFNYTHLHGVLIIKDRESYNAFIREFTSKVVAYLSKSIGIRLRSIFLHRPFTRIVSGIDGLFRLDNYMKKNEKESQVRQTHLHLGLAKLITHLSQKPRKKTLKRRSNSQKFSYFSCFRQLEFF